MNTAIGFPDYSVWLGGIEYVLKSNSIFDADTAQGTELRRQIGLNTLCDLALTLGYHPCEPNNIPLGKTNEPT